MTANFIHHLVHMVGEKGGVTADLKHEDILEPDDFWYFPRYPGLTAIVTQDDVETELVNFSRQHHDLLLGNYYLGAWINPLTRECYLDIATKMEDKAAAVAAARQYSEEGGRKIVTIYNPLRDETVRVWPGVNA